MFPLSLSIFKANSGYHVASSLSKSICISNNEKFLKYSCCPMSHLVRLNIVPVCVLLVLKADGLAQVTVCGLRVPSSALLSVHFLSLDLGHVTGPGSHHL